MSIYPKKNTTKDCEVNFKVNFDFGGFLQYTNKTVMIQKISRILQPVIIA